MGYLLVAKLCPACRVAIAQPSLKQGLTLDFGLSRFFCTLNLVI
jgi:hypothetical protein